MTPRWAVAVDFDGPFVRWNCNKSSPSSIGARPAIRPARATPETRQIRLSEGVELKSSTGLLLQMQGLDIAMDQTLVQSHGAVSVAGPFGQLTAQDFRLSAAEGQPNVYVMVFKGRVRLLYQPEK